MFNHLAIYHLAQNQLERLHRVAARQRSLKALMTSTKEPTWFQQLMRKLLNRIYAKGMLVTAEQINHMHSTGKPARFQQWTLNLLNRIYAKSLIVTASEIKRLHAE